MDKRRLTIEIALGMVLLVAAGVFVWRFLGRTDDTGEVDINQQPQSGLNLSNTASNATSANVSAGVITNVSANASASSDEQAAVAQLRQRAKQLAITFAERFGSYSSDNNYSNIEDTFLFLTPEYKAKAQATIAAGRSQPSASSEYFGIVTRAITTREIAYDVVAERSEFLVTTQRRRTQAGKTSVTTQAMIVKLKLLSGQWRVDDAVWQ